MSRAVVVLRVSLIAGVFAPALAHGYSTKLHMLTGAHIADMLDKKDAQGNRCKLTLGGWNKVTAVTDKYGRKSTLDLRVDPKKVGAKSGWVKPDKRDVDNPTKVLDLSGEICNLITNPATRQYFVSATTGPDTFPGMFGNTDPTHALVWNTSWQIAVLWQNAKTPEEKAFALGWLFHFAGDLNAHGLANLHANGIWMSDGFGDSLQTVIRHIVAETYYAKYLTPYPPNFDNRLVWPKPFVKKMFFNPESPLYKHYDYNFNTHFTAEGDDLGAVSKVFSALFRTIFLVWDWAAREGQVWEARRKDFVPRKNNSVKDYIHWIFADQVANWFQKKAKAADKAVDRWYEATHRAQQATVADNNGLWKVMWDKKKGEKPEYDGGYAKSGVGGIMGAYKYLGEALWELISPDLITINENNFPALANAISFLKKSVDVVKVFAKDFAGQIQAILYAFMEIPKQIVKAVLAPIALLLKPVREWIDKKFGPYMDLFKDDVRQWICGKVGVGPICTAIDNQRKAFRVVPERIETYLQWPIYVNTITAGGLMLDKMKTMNKNEGDETMSPTFGLPSGDFGCTIPCAKFFEPNRAYFMPVAGKYFRDPDIRRDMPDYCADSNDRRDNADKNGEYRGLTNLESNATSHSEASFTCLDSKNARSVVCKGESVYRRAVDWKIGSTGFKGKVKTAALNAIEWFFKKIGGRWDHRVHKIPADESKWVMPAEVGEPTVNPKSKAEKYAKKPKSVVQKDASVRPTVIEKKIGSGVICYQALKYNGATVAKPLANPWDFHGGLQAGHKPGTYFLGPMVGKLLKDMGDFLTAGVTNAKAWVENKISAAKKWAAKKIGEGVDWAKKVGGEAIAWVSGQLSAIKAKFDNLVVEIKDHAHKAHFASTCWKEIPPFANQVAGNALSYARSKYKEFLNHVGGGLKSVPVDKRNQAVAGAWNQLKAAISKGVGEAMSKGAHRTRDWATKNTTKKSHWDRFIAVFSNATKGLLAEMDAALLNLIAQNAPPATSGANELCKALSKDLRPSAGSGPGVNWGNGKAYFFRGNQYTKYDIASDKPEGGYPRAIAGSWGAGFWNGAPDAAVNWGNGFVYFFKGAEYIKYDIAADRPVDGYPRKIAGSWGDKFFGGGVDAAVEWDKNTAFFFKGTQYLKYDIKADKVVDGYPQPLNDANWPGLCMNRVEGAVNWGNGKVYFFKGGAYVRYDIKADKVDPGYPQPVNNQAWPGLP